MSVTEAATRPAAVPRLPSVARSLVLLALAVAVLGLLGRIMGYDLRRDEFMFVPPAALLDEHDLYRDLFYNHVPYSAWLFRAVHQLLPFLGLLAAARLTVFMAWLLLLGSAGWIGWRLTRSPSLTLFAPVSLLTAEVLLGQTGMAATNNLLPLPFALVGLGLLSISLAEGDLRFDRLFLAGMMLSVAAGMKASAIAFIPAVAIGCFLMPPELRLSERIRRLVLPVGLGGLIGALPLFWLALTMPETFFAHIAGYHAGPHVAFWQANASSEPGLALSPPQKLQLAYSVWLVGAPMLAMFAACWGWFLMRRGRGVTGLRGMSGTHAVFRVVLAATVTTAVLAFVPTPGFPQYYVAPLVGFPVLTALAYRAMSDPSRVHFGAAMMVAAAMMAVFAAPRLGLGLAALRDPAALTPARIARSAELLRARLAEAGLADAGPVATLSPLYPLEAGLPIYPEFSAGPFAYRVAPYTEPALRAEYAMAGAEDLDALFAARPPAAILTGFDAELEAPFEAYARANGFTRAEIPEIRDRYGEARLWLSPDAVTPQDQTGDIP
ncbi:hypothetical protein SAMN05421538_101564 [Paracoccus isoporae]|uniref:Dolichyl-phosphate-mannose-protein mannosyltransferase n=1 Tax=Paracoccus isoporae TaxID=591205 RepID=A0A1G6UJB8_9RHOB|nr:hypothetical protein [Paracoccus isoporae]SDD41452.1 hypothetical protein SAMN05421538_101564 [Paracoccus isoporae]